MDDRSVLVAWSLGNFIDNMKVRYTDSGIILDFTLIERPDGTFAVQNVGYVPVYCWKQTDNIRTLCSGEYIDERPEGMDSATYDRMLESRRELIDLIGDGFALLEN